MQTWVWGVCSPGLCGHPGSRALGGRTHSRACDLNGYTHGERRPSTSFKLTWCPHKGLRSPGSEGTSWAPGLPGDASPVIGRPAPGSRGPRAGADRSGCSSPALPLTNPYHETAVATRASPCLPDAGAAFHLPRPCSSNDTGTAQPQAETHVAKALLH